MKILIIGAGVVGKVHGRHLAMGGAKVSFFVKEKHAEDARKGFHFYPLNDSKHREHSIFWKDYEVLTKAESVQKQKWDFVLLAMSSPALRSGWFDEFVKWIPGTDVVCLQPGMNDQEYMLARVSPKNLIEGTIHLSGYETPFESEVKAQSERAKTPGTAYWFPPTTFAAFSGSSPKISTLLQTLNRGNFSAKKVDDVRKLNVAAAPALILLVYGIKQCDWSFEKFGTSPWSKKIASAVKEAIPIQAKKFNANVPPSFFLTPAFYRSILWAVQKIAPFDFEAFTKVHFEKVDDQMEELLNDFIQIGEVNALKTTELKKLKSEAHAR